MDTRPAASRTRRLVLCLLLTVSLLVAGELAARVFSFVRSGNAQFLTMSFGGLPQQEVLLYRPRETVSGRFDRCAGRHLTFTVNNDGGRGAPWRGERARGAVRLLVVGESSAFGVNSDDDATWPARLEAEIRARGVSAEVFNGAQPGTWLDTMVTNLEVWLPRFRPDAVLYYGAYNNALPVDAMTRTFFASLLGRVSAWLYYRSMLYTSLVEKIAFAALDRPGGLATRLTEYLAGFDRLVAITARYGVRLVVVLQATRLSRVSDLAGADSADDAGLRATIRRLADGRGWSKADVGAALRQYATQAFVEVLRRQATKHGVPVLDPRPVLERADPAVFCDEIHLSDRGNAVLAAAIADGVIDAMRDFPTGAARASGDR